MGKKYFVLFACLFLFACVNNNFRKVKLISVYDGDTFKVNLTCRKEIFCKNISVRVKGIDAPEIKTANILQKEKADKAKVFTEKFLSKGKIKLNNCQRDKYFRLLCDVEVNNQNLSEELIKGGYAVFYDGGTKKYFDNKPL